jgi:hypothetical protein
MATAFRELAFLAARRVIDSLFQLLARGAGAETSQNAPAAISESPKDGVIGRPSLWIAEEFWVLRFRLMVKRGPWLRPQTSEGEAQHGPFCWIRRIGQGD